MSWLNLIWIVPLATFIGYAIHVILDWKQLDLGDFDMLEFKGDDADE